MSNALTTIEPQEVTRYAGRIRELMPGGDRLTPQEAESLAQVALLHQLSPFAKELWYLKTDDGRSLGIMAGIAGLRRASSLQLEREGGGSSWCEFDGPFTKEQCKALAIPENSLAYRAKLYDTRSMLAYTEGCERLLKAGMPWEAVRDALGQRPYTEGIGYWTLGERTKMKPVQCAQKRAEAEARRRRFNLPFGSGVGSAQDPDAGDATEGEYTVTKPEPASPATAGNGRTAGSMALYGEPDITEPEPPEPAKEPPAQNENAKPATIKYQPFVAWANEWVQGNGKAYARENNPNLANMFHLLGRIGKLGFSQVTEANADDIKAALESHIAGKADPLLQTAAEAEA